MMQRELSVKKTSPLLKMTLFTLEKNKALILLASILSFLVLPVFPLVSLAEYIAEVIMAALFVCFFISMGITLLLTALNFSFMHLKSSSDLFFSIPMTRRELFSARLLASWLGGLLPMIIPAISGAVLISIYGTKEPDLSSWLSILFFLVTALTGLLLSIVGSFFMVFAGRTFEGVASFLIFNICPPILAFIVVEQMNENLFGMPTTAIDTEFYVGFSPIATAVYYAYSLIDSFVLGKATPLNTSIIIWIFLSAILFVISFLFIKKRKSEAAGNAFAHGLMPAAIILLVSIIAAFLFGVIFTGNITLSAEFFIFAIIGALLCSAVLAAIFNRNFKNLTKCLYLGGASALLYISFMAVITTGGLGYVTRTPLPQNVESATFIIDGSYYSSNTDLASTTITEKEDINALIRVHKNVIQNENINDLEGSNTLVLTYRLKNGKLLERRYHILRHFNKNEIALLDNMENKANNLNYSFGSEEKVRLLVSNEDKSDETQEKDILISREDAVNLIKSYAKENKTIDDAASQMGTKVHLSNIRVHDNGAKLLKLSEDRGVYETVLCINYTHKNTLKLLEEIKNKAS